MVKNHNHPDRTVQDALERADVLREFARIISSSLDHKTILKQSLVQLSRVLHFDSASIYLLPYRSQSEFVAGIGFTDENLTSREAESLLKDSPIIQQMQGTLLPILSGDVNTLEGWVWVSGAEHVCSFMGVPLIANKEMIGALMFDSRQTNQFSQYDLEMVVPLAQQIAISIENARLFEEVQHQLFLSYTLQQVGALLTTGLSLDDVYEQLLDLLAQVVKYDSVSFQLFDDESETLELVAGRGFVDFDKMREFLAAIRRNPMDKFDGANRWQLINDTEQFDLWAPVPSHLGTIRSWIGAKLIVKNRTIGVLNVDNREPNAYTKADAETVAAFANQAAVAIENARLHDETRRRANELEILHEVALQTSALVDVDLLLSQTTQMIADRLHYDSFGLAVVDKVTGQLSIHPSYHGLTDEQRKMALHFNRGVVAHVVKTGKPRIVTDVRREADYLTIDERSLSEIAVPVLVRGEKFGAINAESHQVNAFAYYDLRFLMTLALQVGTAVERAQLYAVLQQHAEDLKLEVASRTAELQMERDRTLAILESAGEGIFLTDLDGTILYVNPAMVRQSGYMRSELLGVNPRILQSLHTPPGLFQDMWRTLKQGESWSGELVNRRKDGQMYDISMTIVPLRDADDKIVNYVSVQSDISRIKEVERLKSTFVSNVSHELRTPLTNITTYLKLMEKGREERRARYLEVLNMETRRLTRLIQDLLDLSQLEMEPYADTAVSSDLVAEANTHFNLFLAQADAKQIQYSIKLPAEPIFVNIESRHLGQLLTNLLGNAFAYTPEHGAVSLEVGLDQPFKMAYLKVTDTGTGIAQEEISRLFDRFYRGEAAQDKGIPGTGLGLAICKEITDRWGGRIDVESKLGEGSQFTAWLPLGL
ncbi:MAG: GAF domain-containing protein [Ardenticatenaceae bacterium]|nr:GAF domain-containing protein [Ardenticatenaceae bacterium]MCB9444806.1 GAF domain-containing protein [Ardenticatenaceae bacterium]